MCTYTTSVKENASANERARMIKRLLKKGKTPEEINELLDIPLDEIEKVEASLLTAAK